MKLALRIDGAAEETIEILTPAPDCRFRAGNLHTGFFARQGAADVPEEMRKVTALAAALHTTKRNGNGGAAPAGTASRWVEAGRSELLR
jgi:hypothetical protein